MITPQFQALLNRAEESHQAAKIILEKGFSNFFRRTILNPLYFVLPALTIFSPYVLYS